MTDMVSWCRSGTYGQPSETGRGCRALFETAEPNSSKDSPDQLLLKKLIGRWSSGKKGHKSDARVRACFRKIRKVSISRWTQMDCTNAEGVSRETTPFTSRWYFVQQKAGNARPPSDSTWGSQFDDGKDTREILDTSPQKTKKESDKWVTWV